jgi:hypothetical protein
LQLALGKVKLLLTSVSGLTKLSKE